VLHIPFYTILPRPASPYNAEIWGAQTIIYAMQYSFQTSVEFSRRQTLDI